MKNRWIFLILVILLTFVYFFQEVGINRKNYEEAKNSFIFKTNLENGKLISGKDELLGIEINGNYIDFNNENIIDANLYLYLDELGDIYISKPISPSEFSDTLPKIASLTFKGITYYLGGQVPISKQFYIFTDKEIYLADYGGMILEQDETNSSSRYQKALSLFTIPPEFFTTKYY